MKNVTKELTNDLSKVYSGINKTVDAVKSTMGAQGKTVLILNNDQLKITKDGITVAKAITLEDDIERAGNKLVINAAQKTVDEVGDGTTATCVLLQALNEECQIEDRGRVNEILDQMQVAVNEVEAYLTKTSNKVDTIDQVRSIAKISSNSEVVGDLIADVYEQVGFDAAITLEQSETSSKTTYDILKGLKLRSGMVSLRFANRKNGDCVLDNPIVWISKTRISDFDEYMPLFKQIATDKKSILIISPSFSEGFIRSVLTNVQKGVFNCCLVKSPGFGDGVGKNYDDIFSILNKDKQVEKAIISTHYTTLFNTDTPFLQDRLDELLELAENTVEDYDRPDYLRRYHTLKGSSAVIYTGGTTEQNIKEEYDRIEDALGSVKAAIDGGYVEGGGVALYKARLVITGTDYGAHVIRNVCEYPATTILINANDGDKEPGYNVRTRQYENFLETGVIDPTQVVIQSLRNAFATFKLLKNTDYTIYNDIDYGLYGK